MAEIIVMKKALIAIALLLVSTTAIYAQTAKMQYDGVKDIRAICGNYLIYFSLIDMKEAFMELPAPVQKKYAEFMDLPNGIKATVNIIQGSKAPASIMEPVLQRQVGGYLLKQGLAYIETKDGKKITMLEVVEGEAMNDEADFNIRPVTFYEPGTKKAVFSGTMNTVFK